MQCTEGCEGRCEGDCCRWDHWQGVVTPQGLCQWAIFITDEHTHTHFFSPFIHKVEIKISCCNYCLVRRSNSAKLTPISSYTGYLAPAVLYMFQQAAVEGNGTVM